MALLLRNQFYGLPNETRVYPGVQGVSDIGAPAHLETFPEPGHAFSTVTSYRGSYGLTPYVTCAAFINRSNVIGWRLSSDWWNDATASDTYSFTYEVQWIGDYLQAGRRRFLQFMDGSTVRWGLEIFPKANPWDDDWTSNKVAIVNGAGSVLAGGTVTMYVNTWYRFEVEAKTTSNKLTVRMYQLSGGTTWQLWTTMTVSSGTFTANRVRHGCFVDQQSNYNGNTLSTHIRNVFAWDSANADGNFPASGDNSFVAPPFPDNTYQVMVAGSPVTVAQPKKMVGGVESSMDTTWRLPEYGMRGKREIQQTYTSDAGNTQYSTASDNCRYLIYYPSGTAPAGGWPCVIWVTTNYYYTGDYLGILTDHYPMMQTILSAGWAVASVGVRLSLIDGGGPKYPDQIIDAKLAARHIYENAPLVDGDKLIIGGHSSGGSIGMCAMISRDLANDGYGKDLRLAGNGYSGTDPVFLGSLVFSAPTDFATTYTNDPTHPYQSNTSILYGTLYGQYMGDVRAAVNIFSGGSRQTTNPNLDGLDPADWMPSMAYPRPILFLTSDGDCIVPKWNSTNLKDAYAAKGHAGMFTEVNQGKMRHDKMTHIPHAETIKAWLKARLVI